MKYTDIWGSICKNPAIFSQYYLQHIAETFKSTKPQNPKTPKPHLSDLMRDMKFIFKHEFKCKFSACKRKIVLRENILISTVNAWLAKRRIFTQAMQLPISNEGHRFDLFLEHCLSLTSRACYCHEMHWSWEKFTVTLFSRLQLLWSGYSWKSCLNRKDSRLWVESLTYRNWRSLHYLLFHWFLYFIYWYFC